MTQPHIDPALVLAALQASSQPLAVLDEKGALLFGNAAWEKLELVASTTGNVFDVFAERTGITRPLTQGFAGVISGKTPEFNAECVLTIQGRRCDVNVRLKKLGTAKSASVLVEVQDLTSFKSEDAKRAQAEKMDALGKLAGTIAHDFNNLLMVIKGYGELLERNASKPETVKKHSEQILGATTRGATFTGHLLTFGRGKPAEPYEVPLKALVTDAADKCKGLLGDKIKLSVQHDPSCGAISCDPTQLTQSILYLASNACEAMPEGGTLTIKTEAVSVGVAELPYTPVLATGEYAVVTVADTGRGMEEFVKARLFEPLYGTKPKGKALGMGLATTYAFIKNVGGSISVQSAPGKGTTVKLYFPRTTQVIATGPSIAHSSEMNTATLTSAPAATATILLVEDDPSVRGLVQEILSMHGYKVIEASNGAEAIDKAVIEPGVIDLLMTDLVLPGANGRLISERLTLMRPKMKTLYTSGYTSQSVVTDGTLTADMEFLQKPFSTDALLKRIVKILGK